MVAEEIVVVGGGLAGLRTVEELRSAGYQGSLTLLGAEARPPYDRPPLSKQLMAGAVDDTTLRTDLESLGARIKLGERAEQFAPGTLRTDQAEYDFDRLVIATGARPIGLPGPGKQRFLRSMDDALTLRDLLLPGRRLAIVGAGWIGAELATAAARKGCQVSVVEAGPAPLAAAIGTDVGALTVPWYEQAGVELLLGCAVESVQDGGLSLVGGGWLPVDELVTAVGVKPDVGWLDSSGIAIDNGVVVDEQLRASMTGVYAVGDCASFWSTRFGRRLRTEHWDGALRAPAVLAANLLGDTRSYDPVPYFWSEQFGRMLQYVGHHTAADRLIWRGDPTGPRWAACWVAANKLAGDKPAGDKPAGDKPADDRPADDRSASDRLVAVLTVDLPKDLVQGRRVIESAAPVDPDKLADPTVQIRSAVLT